MTAHEKELLTSKELMEKIRQVERKLAESSPDEADYWNSKRLLLVKGLCAALDAEAER